MHFKLIMYDRLIKFKVVYPNSLTLEYLIGTKIQKHNE